MKAADLGARARLEAASARVTGLCGAGAWALGFLWMATRPESLVDARGGGDRARMLTTYFDPNYVSVLKYENEILAFLLVSAGLALLVRRSRPLVAERAEAEWARGNLARYFSPKVVDTLAGRDEPLGRVRRQAVGVLFADLVGFTALAQAMTPEEVMVVMGDIGSARSMDFATVGDTTNAGAGDREGERGRHAAGGPDGARRPHATRARHAARAVGGGSASLSATASACPTSI